MLRRVGDVYPKAAPRPTKSEAEIKVWQALQNQLPAGWRAWHSLRLRHKGYWEGEGDFVIAAPDRGLLVLEVKGGAIELRGGRWYQNGDALKQAPRDQALAFVDHLIKALRARGIETPPFGVACVFPDVEFSDDAAPSTGDLDGIVLSGRQLDWLEHALPAALERAVPPYAMPKSRSWLAALHELWGETWVPSLSLTDERNDSEARVVSLVADQLDLLAAADDNPRAVVTGGAGTGKTLLARELCSRAAQRGQRVLYLCFTNALGHAVERSFATAQRAGARARAFPIRRFAATLLEASGARIAETDQSFWDNASLTAACDALPPIDDRPELVVVDEAQDLEPGDWDLVAELVGPRALWILGDDRQAFWKRPEVPASLTAGAARLKLRTQHRCPSAIAAFAQRYVAPSDGRASDPAVAASSAPDTVRLLRAEPGYELARVQAEITELIRGGAKPRDIAIVTLAGQTVSKLLALPALGSYRVVRADTPEVTEQLVADTFLRFKGLERPFVFVVELASGHLSQYERRMHIAATRALARLYVVATADDVAKDPRLAVL